jgi:putative peptidoglycan lipid II flippase
VASATSFDPPPQGSGDENPSQAELAIDGNPETFWSTLVYFDGAEFGGSKPGVGLVLDLGKAKEVSSAKVTLIGSPTTLELRAAPEDATRPPLLAPGYTKVSTLTDAGTRGIFTLDKPVKTRYLLVWITSMPKVPNGYQGKVAEIQVFG